ncbi:putative conserved membrane protein [Synechococcus sp. WH 8101]|nr:hypothetical protein [Synechococcus sp. WH 8101]QNI45985.1 putative conserved membrane protein [Synechococcus sp. WH 8101]
MMHPPSIGELLKLEQQVRCEGTGLRNTDLQGSWRLQSVWSRSGKEASAISSWMLRLVKARLELTDTRDGSLSISNVVNLGALELRFRGSAQLHGPRPLLRFQFDSLSLTFGKQTLLQRPLTPTTEPRRQPFFALIRRDPSGWLAARGRGGGLALWSLKG